MTDQTTAPRRAGRCASLALLLLLPLTLTPAQAQMAVMNQQNPGAGFSTVERDYPSMDRRYSRSGNVTAVDDLRELRRGETREQLVATLGQPAIAYNDGSWEFHLSLPLTQTDRLICQYRVFFDAEGRVDHGVWRRPQCADIWANG